MDKQVLGWYYNQSINTNYITINTRTNINQRSNIQSRPCVTKSPWKAFPSSKPSRSMCGRFWRDKTDGSHSRACPFAKATDWEGPGNVCEVVGGGGSCDWLEESGVPGRLWPAAVERKPRSSRIRPSCSSPMVPPGENADVDCNKSRAFAWSCETMGNARQANVSRGPWGHSAKIRVAACNASQVRKTWSDCGARIIQAASTTTAENVSVDRTY